MDFSFFFSISLGKSLAGQGFFRSSWKSQFKHRNNAQGIGFTNEGFAKYSRIATSYSLETCGDTDSTRNEPALRGRQTEKLIEQLLNEGRRMESPVSFKY